MHRLQFTVDLEPTGDAVLRRIEPALVRREVRNSWPGTTLFESSATVATYRLTTDVVAALTTATSGLYGWQQPDLPEDLCLLRDEDDPWLVSIAHEGDAFVRVDADELKELRRRVPRFTAVLMPEDPTQF